MSTYGSYTDPQLLELLKLSDHEAFTEIYRRYWDRLFYLGGKLLNDLMAAEEIVQDVFLDIWQRRDRLEVTGQLEHYLVVALRYRVINLQARQHRADTYTQYAVRSLPMQDFSTEEQVRAADLKSWLETLVSRMPEKSQLAYRLREEGRSYREIAAQMQVSEKTVENHIGRALKYLRTALGYFSSLFL